MTLLHVLGTITSTEDNAPPINVTQSLHTFYNHTRILHYTDALFCTDPRRHRPEIQTAALT